MKPDVIQQYSILRERLLREKLEIEERLKGIKLVLGTNNLPQLPETAVEIPKRIGRPKANAMSMKEAILKVLSKGPLGRKEIVQEVQRLGYRFRGTNPLNSIGSVLYSKQTGIKNKDKKYYLVQRSVA